MIFPPLIPRTTSSVALLSAGWTNSTKNFARSSSKYHPSAAVQLEFSSLNIPSKPAMQSMSSDNQWKSERAYHGTLAKFQHGLVSCECGKFCLFGRCHCGALGDLTLGLLLENEFLVNYFELFNHCDVFRPAHRFFARIRSSTDILLHL